MKNCIVYLPSLSYTRDWAQAYANTFRKLGYTVNTIDLTEHNTFAPFASQLMKVVDKDTEFILSIFGQGSDIAYNGESIYDYLKIPLLAVCIDHAEYYKYRMELEGRQTYWGLFDASDIHYCVNYISPDKNFFFLPNAGFEAAAINKNFKQRLFDVTFIGIIYDYEYFQNEWRKLNNPYITGICENMAEVLLADEEKTVIEALEEVQLYNNIFSFNKAKMQINHLLTCVSHYVRGIRRELQIKTLANNGVKLHCFGDKKELDKLLHPNFIKHGYLNTEEYLNVLGESKIVINSLPMARQATTERLVSGMLNGAAVATDGNLFVDGYYEDGKSMIRYTHNGYDLLSERITQLLDRQNDLEEIAANGQSITQECHTLEERAKTLLSMVDFDKYVNKN